MFLNRDEIREQLLKQGTRSIKGEEHVLTGQPKAAPAGGNGFILFARTVTTPPKDVAIKVFLRGHPVGQEDRAGLPQP